MHIVHVAAEMAPIAKVGGLADVTFGLTRALISLGHEIEIYLPMYKCIKWKGVKRLKLSREFWVKWDGKQTKIKVHQGLVEGVRTLFIEAKSFFKRGQIYGYPDDSDRFALFSLAVAEDIKRNNPCDLIHIHDWQTALIPQLLPGSPTLLTIHNLSYQGITHKKLLKKLGIKGPLKEYQAYRDQSLLNLLKGGILTSDEISTVSKSYAREILTKEHGAGLQRALLRIKEHLVGIVNGIDTDYWNPKTDPLLPFNYDAKTIKKKAQVKKALRKRFGLEECDRPIIGVISRLVPQKGVELMESAATYIPDNGGQFALLGVSPIKEINERFLELKMEERSNPHLSIKLDQSEKLAHLIYGGCDMLLVPSLFEPCGLTQLIAMRYGTIPIVRKTGGLADTVTDVLAGGHGYSFVKPTERALHACLKRALNDYHNKKTSWDELVARAMAEDTSWQEAANQYMMIYHKLV